ncbi:MAG: DNA-directed RNA polymerase subunit omega [Oscillospiraceae bacterium]|nr:DNA-directed RNA polymerase subunit omega [Oscillospiraceae bacterium]
MLDHTMSELLTKVGSRYLLVNAIAKRARQLSDEAVESRMPLRKKAVSIAIDDIAKGKYSVEGNPDLY